MGPVFPGLCCAEKILPVWVAKDSLGTSPVLCMPVRQKRIFVNGLAFKNSLFCCGYNILYFFKIVKCFCFNFTNFLKARRAGTDSRAALLL